MLKVVINFVYFQAFARLSAVYGGTYMLAKPECKVCDICVPSSVPVSVTLSFVKAGCSKKAL
jgi:RAB protein geranylgeranyltransferase component A